MFSRTRSYASLMTVLPRSKMNQVMSAMVTWLLGCWVAGLLGCWVAGLLSCWVGPSNPATQQPSNLHPKHAKPWHFDRRVVADGKCQPEVVASFGGIDDPVVPQPGGAVVRASLTLIFLQNRIGDRAFLLARQLFSFARELIALHRRQHPGGLLAAHHADASVRPDPQKSRTVGASAHTVISRAEGAADDDREFRHSRVGNGVHHLR